MKKQFRILMVGSEAVPFAKSGGLGDMVSALSKSLRDEGHDVRILIPRYYSIDKSKLTFIEGAMGIVTGDSEIWTGIYESVLPGSDVPVYFLDQEQLYGRAGIYGPSTAVEFPDNALRYNVLSLAAFQLCRKLDWIPDIMHCHDWPSGLIPVYLQTYEKKEPFLKTASVMTIHNLAHQGVFSKENMCHLKLTWGDYFHTGIEYYDQLNYLKAGLHNAEIITTVSPTYSKEIQTPEFGEHLELLLHRRNSDLFGILNGVDYKEWDPEHDPYISPDNFTSDDLNPKTRLKMQLQEKAGLKVDPGIPLIGMITRLVNQKGIAELCAPTYGSLHSICTSMNVQFVILGTGESWCEEELRILDSKMPNMKAWLTFSNELAQLIEAGSDFFLMPSAYEPCGLNQIYSLRYGTLPIVRNTGGLADTVKNYNQLSGEGTGYIFNDLTPNSIYNVVGWAVWSWFNRPEHIRQMRKSAMSQNFSWNKSTAQYMEIYQWALDRKSGEFPRSW